MPFSDHYTQSSTKHPREKTAAAIMQPISKFVFTNEDEKSTQTFRHQLYVHGKVHECPSCYSRIDADEPPSQHWINRPHGNSCLQLSKQQRAVLDIIESHQIDTFFFCDESARDNLDEFIAETCAYNVPELLRWMFRKRTMKLEFNVALYVNVLNQVLIFQSGSVAVEHYLDIEEYVTVVYDMLMQRIENYLSHGLDIGLEECSITRVRVQIKRQHDDGGDSPNALSMATLPLKLRHNKKAATNSSTTTEEELATLQAAYVKHQRECHGYFPSNMRVNFYGLQQCATTREIYVVPHHISETLQEMPNKNFLILNDIMGQFQQLHEMPTPLVSANEISTERRPSSLQCRRCNLQFTQYSKLHIHQELRCGEDFTVDSMHADMVEIYEGCLPISRSASQHACYGITKPKTIMRKGQFVPIECDWRSESSVKVQHGPCVVISNNNSSPSKYY